VASFARVRAFAPHRARSWGGDGSVSLCGASASLDKICMGLYSVTGSSPRRSGHRAPASKRRSARVPKVEGSGPGEGPYLPVKLLRCMRSAQKVGSGRSSVVWRLGDAPVRNPRPERGVEGVEGGCRHPPPPSGALARLSDRRGPPRWRVCGGVVAARERRPPHSRAGWTRRLGLETTVGWEEGAGSQAV